MDTKKKSDNPALSLFITDPDIARLLHNSEQRLLKHRDELTTIADHSGRIPYQGFPQRRFWPISGVPTIHSAVLITSGG
jgi:hypothetical protein